MNLKLVMEKIQQQLDWTFIPKILTPALLITLITISLNVGKAVQRIESLTFDSAKQKEKVISLVDNHMSDVEVYKFKNSVTELELKQVKLQADIDEMKEALVRIEENQTK
jgi:hypothetical protein